MPRLARIEDLEDLDHMKYLGDGKCYPSEVTIDDFILEYLSRRPLNRTQLSILTKIPMTTLYDHLVKLMEDHKVKRFTNNFQNSRGRPKVYYRLLKV